MVDAVVESTGSADFAEARRRLTAAMNHARSAEKAVDNESAFILLYSAVHKALGAALLAVGLRVGSGERGHVVLIQEAKKQLGSEHAQLLTRLDRARRKRNNVSYETQTVAEAELKSMTADTLKTLETVGRFVQEKAAEADKAAKDEAGEEETS
jgi:hypothetical protein